MFITKMHWCMSVVSRMVETGLTAEEIVLGLKERHHGRSVGVALVYGSEHEILGKSLLRRKPIFINNPC